MSRNCAPTKLLSLFLTASTWKYPNIYVGRYAAWMGTISQAALAMLWMMRAGELITSCCRASLIFGLDIESSKVCICVVGRDCHTFTNYSLTCPRLDALIDSDRNSTRTRSCIGNVVAQGVNILLTVASHFVFEHVNFDSQKPKCQLHCAVNRSVIRTVFDTLLHN